MSCFNPMQALRSDSAVTKTGKSVITFLPRGHNVPQDYPSLLSGLSCGQCVGCRLERSRQWAIRCVNEAQLHEDNCFITLTFNDESLLKRDSPFSLDKREFQLFMKRLRKHFKVLGKKVRYYMCGEYGERYQRPHYHAILFGVDFSDKVLEKVENGFRYYSSKILASIWPFGNNIITDVTFDTCAYVARYIMKKHLGKDAWRQYHQYIDEQTGEIVGLRIPEYTTMSRRSGIGKEWLDKYLLDVYPRDRIFMRGRGFSKPPKYYDTLFEVINPLSFSSIKESRVEAAKLRSSDNTSDRLHAKEVVKLSQIRSLSRNLE